jgi:hypothetical protein
MRKWTTNLCGAVGAKTGRALLIIDRKRLQKAQGLDGMMRAASLFPRSSFESWNDIKLFLRNTTKVYSRKCQAFRSLLCCMPTQNPTSSSLPPLTRNCRGPAVMRHSFVYISSVTPGRAYPHGESRSLKSVPTRNKKVVCGFGKIDSGFGLYREISPLHGC